MPRFFKSLFGQVVIALLVGIAVGVLYPDFGASLKPLGDRARCWRPKGWRSAS